MIIRTAVSTLALLWFGMAHAAPEKQIVDGVTYHVLHAPATSIRIIWKDDNGTALRTFPSVSQFLMRKGVQPDTLMNGGIFEPGGIPSGLLVQDGKELNPVNRNKGEGNFFLHPNGIFLVGNAGAAVVRTDEYPPGGVRIQQAVQSGPLLLRQGKVHPAFKAESGSRLHRNGVGVTKSGKVVFAMTDFHSQKFPNLHEFARLFRTLDCDDALFLDGDLCQMRSGNELMNPSNHFGSIIAVTESPKGKQEGVGQPATRPGE